MRLVAAIVLVACLGGVVCRAPQAQAEETTPFVGLTPLDPLSADDRDPARLERLADIGRVLVSTTPIAWGIIQPARPGAAGAGYRWKSLDDAVLVWQLTGFDPVLVLSPSSPWACVPREKTSWVQAVRKALPPAEADAALRGVDGAPPPLAALWSRWERFVRDVVERYDGDGTKDMPGLRRPVRHIQVLGGIDPVWWLGDADQLLRLLHHAAEGIRAASTTCRLLAPSVDLRATGHAPFPDEREWNYRIGLITPGSAKPLARQHLLRHFAILKRLLGMPRLFDILCQRGSAHVADDVANLTFLRRTLNEAGGDGKGLWLVDNPSRKLGRGLAVGIVEPKREERQLRQTWLTAARRPTHPQHGRAQDWLRRGQAYDLVRGLCRARAAGADAVLCYAPGDRLPTSARQATAGQGQGLLRRRAGQQPGATLERTPSWWALRQASRLLQGQTGALETRIGAPGQSVIFQLARKGPRPWVAVLLLDARLSWAGTPGAPLPLQDVLVTLPSGAYRLEWIQTGPAKPRFQEVVSDGSLTVALGPEPVYIIPKR